MDREEIKREWEQGRLIAPAVDIYASGDDFIIRANMPGVRKGDVEVSLSNGELVMYGRAGSPDRDDECCYILHEIDEGNYYRAFQLGETIDISKIKAKVEDGILTVTLPRHERMKPREIQIEAG